MEAIVLTSDEGGDEHRYDAKREDEVNFEEQQVEVESSLPCKDLHIGLKPNVEVTEDHVEHKLNVEVIGDYGAPGGGGTTQEDDSHLSPPRDGAVGNNLSISRGL